MVAGGWWSRATKEKSISQVKATEKRALFALLFVVVFIKIYQVLPITIIWIYRTLLFTNSAFLLQNDRQTFLPMYHPVHAKTFSKRSKSASYYTLLFIHCSFWALHDNWHLV